MRGAFIIFFLTLTAILHGQKVNFEWVRQMGGADQADGRGSSITTDVAGNIYTNGFFKGQADFDPGQGVYNLVALGTEDSYSLKVQ